MFLDFEVDGKKYKVKTPNHTDNNNARRVYNRVHAECLKDGAKYREEIRKEARARGIITEDQEAVTTELLKKIRDLETVLDEGGIEIEEAKKIAVELGNVRAQLFAEQINVLGIFAQSIEKQAEDAQNDYLLSVCILNEFGNQPYCKNQDDFVDKQNSGDPVVMAGIAKYNELVYGFNSDYLKQLPENQFLMEYGFMNENLEMVDAPKPVKKEKKPFLKNGEAIVK